MMSCNYLISYLLDDLSYGCRGATVCLPGVYFVILHLFNKFSKFVHCKIIKPIMTVTSDSL